MEGKITRVVADKQFFFIDKDYWCHNNSYNREPVEGDIVSYEKEERAGGKKNAKNVRYLSSPESPFTAYLKELDKGYFNNNQLKKEFIIDYPQELVKIFQSDQTKNKPTQIRRFYDQCKTKIEGRYRLTGDFEWVKKELLLIIPIASAAKNKGHVTNEFFGYMEKNINEAVKSPVNFIDGFIPHFQSIIGYYNQK